MFADDELQRFPAWSVVTQVSQAAKRCGRASSSTGLRSVAVVAPEGELRASRNVQNVMTLTVARYHCLFNSSMSKKKQFYVILPS
jgi:hypothetical protein